MDYNELNILADYQIYNLLFAKNELLMDDEKASYFMDVFWKLLGIKDDWTKEEDQISASTDFEGALN